MSDRHNFRSVFYIPVLLIIFVIVSDRSSVSGRWLKRYIENYHRPHYYHERHGFNNHVDYNRERIEKENPDPEGGRKDYQKKINLSGGESEDGNSKTDFYVEILHRHSVICSGTLIGAKKVVTSTRCFLPMSLDPVKEFVAKDLHVRLGRDIGHMRTKPPHRVSALYFPENQRHHGIGIHQIAVLTLSEAVQGTYVKPIELCASKPSEGAKALLLHLDTTEYAIKRYATTLVPTEKCKNIFKEGGNDYVQISASTFCVGNKNNTREEACNTRVGDPLLIDNKLCGVNLYGEHCNEYEGQPENVDIYVDVNEMKSFINRY